MIKTKKINDVKVTPFWNKGNGEKKPVTPLHSLISNEPYLNIICCGRKKSGKTTTSLYMLKHFVTNKTQIIVFSPDIEHDKDNFKALNLIRKRFGDESIAVIDNFFDKDGNNIFLNEIDDAGERFDLENKSKWEYPKTIFYFDDLPSEELKSKELGHFAQNNRHYGSLCIYSSQDWVNFEPRIRKNCDLLLLWASVSKLRLKDIYDTIQPGVNFDEFLKLYNYAVSGKKNFFYIDVVNKIFRKNFDEELYIKKI